MRKKLLLPLIQKTTTLATTTAMMTIPHPLLTLREATALTTPSPTPTTPRLTNSLLHQRQPVASHNIPTSPSHHITLKIMRANNLQLRRRLMTHMVTRQHQLQGQVTM